MAAGQERQPHEKADTMTETAPELRTYMIQRFRMTANRPLEFSGGERIVAVLRSDVVPGGVNESDQMDLIVLVELPPRP